ncbi:hypothetical protein SynA18461_00046 [Synechococcus sp. A18-46.1]|nr:hypothetical protein SynA18461_00046 [Synechococcus sp. A18-46.1]
MLSISKTDSSLDQRDAFSRAAQNLFDKAKLVAEGGQYSEAGSLILKALDQERRAQSSGPQVLQLIKPRN